MLFAPGAKSISTPQSISRCLRVVVPAIPPMSVGVPHPNPDVLFVLNYYSSSTDIVDQIQKEYCITKECRVTKSIPEQPQSYTYPLPALFPGTFPPSAAVECSSFWNCGLRKVFYERLEY